MLIGLASRALTESQRSAAEPLPSVLPLGQRLQQLYTARVVRLPPATRAFLLVAALEGTGDLRLLTAAGGAGYRLDDLARPSATTWYRSVRTRAR